MGLPAIGGLEGCTTVQSKSRTTFNVARVLGQVLCLSLRISASRSIGAPCWLHLGSVHGKGRVSGADTRALHSYMRWSRWPGTDLPGLRGLKSSVPCRREGVLKGRSALVRARRPFASAYAAPAWGYSSAWWGRSC